MANPEHVDILLQGPEIWNKWRKDNPLLRPDLSKIDVVDLYGEPKIIEKKAWNEPGGPLTHIENQLVLTHIENQLVWKGYDFTDTSFKSAHIKYAFAFENDFTNSDFSNAVFAHSQFVDNTFTKSTFTQTKILNSMYGGNDFSYSELPMFYSKQSSLIGNIFYSSNLMYSSFIETDLKHVNFKGSDLRNSSLEKVNTFNVQFDRQGRYRGIRISDAYGSQRFIRHALDQAFLEEFRCLKLPSESMVKNFVLLPLNLLYGIIYILILFAPFLFCSPKKQPIKSNYIARFRFTTYLLWLIFADCGRSLLLWAGWSVTMALGFAWVFHSLGQKAFELSPKLEWSFHTVAYYSVVTFTTLGFGDVTPVTTAAKNWVMAEVILGYVMLGGLISIFANKLARRSG